MTNETRLNDGEGLAIATPEDFGVSRNGDGELRPLQQRIPGTDMSIRVLPMTGGEIDEWQDILEQNISDDDRVDKFFREYIIEGLGQNGLEEVPDYVVPGLIQAVKNASGHQVFRATEEQQMQETMQQMQLMDNDMVGDVMRDYMKEQVGEQSN